jgi:hypothetical protein
MNSHELICTPERRQAEALKTLSQACDVLGCSYVARADTPNAVQQKLNRHQNGMHKVSEVTCTIGGHPECEKPLKNSAALSLHKAMLHRDLVPQRCPVSGCKSQTV